MNIFEGSKDVLDTKLLRDPKWFILSIIRKVKLSEKNLSIKEPTISP